MLTQDFRINLYDSPVNYKIQWKSLHHALESLCPN